MNDDMIVLLGSKTDCGTARRMLEAAGWPTTKVAVPGTMLFGRRLDLARLFVFDSWYEEDRMVPQNAEWAEEELLCRYADADAAARKIGIERKTVAEMMDATQELGAQVGWQR